VAVEGHVRLQRAHEPGQHVAVHSRLAVAGVELVLEPVDVHESHGDGAAAQGAFRPVVDEVAEEQRWRLQDVELLVVLSFGQPGFLA